jgi:predicted HicB family RNase H-like nuclease
MARRTAPKVTTSTPLGRTLDLPQETVRDKNSQPIDEAYVQELVEAARRAPGRPSLAKGTSPSVAFRLPPELRARAAEIAASEGKTLSQLAREALEARLDRSA